MPASTPELDSSAWMRLALEKAYEAIRRSDPNPRVGCVIVRDGAVIGAGATRPPGGPHAEVEALRDARERGVDVRGATVYVTLEPCSHFGRTPPCADALVAAGVGRVVVAMEDPNPLVAGAGLKRLRDAGIAVDVGPCADAARELNIGFVSRMTRGRPWVRMKLAASLDGRSALDNGVSQWITGDAARHDGHRWRARASALMTGIGTVRADDPRLDVRGVGADGDAGQGMAAGARGYGTGRATGSAPGSEATSETTSETTSAVGDAPRQPWRVLVDSRFEVPLDARIVRNVAEGRRLLVVGAIDDAARRSALADVGCETLVLPGADKVDLPALIAELGRREVNELHVEAGGLLNKSLLRAGCVDELLVYVAPTLLGPGQPMVALPALESLEGRVSLAYHDVARIGDDLRILARLSA